KRPRADFIVDLGAYLAPTLRRALEAIEFDALDGSVERDPGHHLRMGEMAALAAHLPDAVIGITPDRLEMIEQRPLKFPGSGEILQAPGTRLMQRVHHLAVDIELKLVGSGIADTHRFRAFIAARFRQRKVRGG